MVSTRGPAGGGGPTSGLNERVYARAQSRRGGGRVKRREWEKEQECKELRVSPGVPKTRGRRRARGRRVGLTLAERQRARTVTQLIRRRSRPPNRQADRRSRGRRRSGCKVVSSVEGCPEAVPGGRGRGSRSHMGGRGGRGGVLVQLRLLAAGAGGVGGRRVSDVDGQGHSGGVR